MSSVKDTSFRSTQDTESAATGKRAAELLQKVAERWEECVWEGVRGRVAFAVVVFCFSIAPGV